MNKKKINIVFIIDQWGIGGTERQIQYLLEGIDKSKYNIYLAVLRKTNINLLNIQGLNKYIIDINSLLSIKGLIKLFTFAGWLRKNKINVVHTFFQDATLFGVFAVKIFTSSKVIVSFRDMGFWRTPLLILFYEIIYRISDAFIANSNAVRSTLPASIPPQKMNIIYNGITGSQSEKNDLDYSPKYYLEWKLPQNLPIICMVSNLNRKVKRVDLFIDAIPLILKEIQAHFVIVGDGYLKSVFIKQAQQQNVLKNITFTGQRSDVQNILSACQVVVNCSDSEGLSNSVMEAMSIGKPVVASNVLGNQELISNDVTGLLFKPGDSQELAKNLINILTDKKSAKKIGKSAKEFINNNFSLEKMIKMHEKMYFELINFNTISYPKNENK